MIWPTRMLSEGLYQPLLIRQMQRYPSEHRLPLRLSVIEDISADLIGDMSSVLHKHRKHAKQLIVFALAEHPVGHLFASILARLTKFLPDQPACMTSDGNCIEAHSRAILFTNAIASPRVL